MQIRTQFEGWRRLMLLQAILLLAGVTLAVAAEGPWVSLFNGKDLTGWVQHNGKATYVAKDGTIVGTSAPKSPNSFLCTEREYGDFELEFDVWVHPELNSGVQIRSHSKPDHENGRVH